MIGHVCLELDKWRLRMPRCVWDPDGGELLRAVVGHDVRDGDWFQYAAHHLHITAWLTSLR